MLYLQLPLIKPYVRFSPAKAGLSDYLHPVAFATPTWPSGIVSSEVPGSFLEFPARSVQSPFLHLFGNVIKVLPLSSLKSMLSLRYQRYYGQLRLPCQPGKISFPYIYRLPS